ncbi:hypothetical protein HOLleu_16914 [Holothuria leucospilota]|uniref:Uncharacterized protein n=1 Tax=Holothuria leucospilota TaxID=206669 RepID=A0A9Q1C4T6_HOLLE|nr:hypothetical protein HOLleu_16914 [Holothuria leucospilota]
MALGELGRHKIAKTIEMRMISFWLRIINGSERKLSFTIYKLLRALHDKGIYSSPWILKIKNILDSSGMSYIWNDPYDINIPWVKKTLNLRLSDMYEQNWLSEVYENSQCKNYRIFKSRLVLEKYLLSLSNRDRLSLCSFRCGNTKIPAIAGRFLNIDLNDRLCELCTSGSIGDEFHYLFQCTAFKSDREHFLKRYYRVGPNTLKMAQLLTTRNKRVQRNLATFCSIISNRFK